MVLVFNLPTLIVFDINYGNLFKAPGEAMAQVGNEDSNRTDVVNRKDLPWQVSPSKGMPRHASPNKRRKSKTHELSASAMSFQNFSFSVTSPNRAICEDGMTKCFNPNLTPACEAGAIRLCTSNNNDSEPLCINSAIGKITVTRCGNTNSSEIPFCTEGRASCTNGIFKCDDASDMKLCSSTSNNSEPLCLNGALGRIRSGFCLGSSSSSSGSMASSSSSGIICAAPACPQSLPGCNYQYPVLSNGCTGCVLVCSSSSSSSSSSGNLNCGFKVIQTLPSTSSIRDLGWASAVLNPSTNKAYIFGGFSAESYSDQILEYDFTSNTIMTKLGTLPYGLIHSSSAWDPVRNVAYIFGGLSVGFPTGSILQYDPSMDEIKQKSSLPLLNYGSAVVWNTSKNVAYIFGSTHKEVLEFDPASNEVKIKEALLPSRVSFAAAVWDPIRYRAYIFDGTNKTILEYNPSLDTITQKGTLPFERSGYASAVWNPVTKTIYIFGASSPQDKSVFEYDPVSNKVTTKPETSTLGLYYGEAIWNSNTNKAYVFVGQSVVEHSPCNIVPNNSSPGNFIGVCENHTVSQCNNVTPLCRNGTFVQCPSNTGTPKCYIDQNKCVTACTDTFAIHTDVSFCKQISSSSSGLISSSSSGTCVPGTTIEFDIPLAYGLVSSITKGPDGNVWFTTVSNKIGNVRPSGVISVFNTSSKNLSQNNLTSGPDGNLWFTEFTEANESKIARITPSGVITEFNSPALPGAITRGPDGNLWFGADSKIGKINPLNGAITQYDIPWPSGTIAGITNGPDNKIYFGEYNGVIGRINTDGTEATNIAGNYITDGLSSITSGPDGNIYFLGSTQYAGADRKHYIGKITPNSNTITQPNLQYSVLSLSKPGVSIVTGPDNNLWYSDSSSILKYETTPTATSWINAPTQNLYPTSLTAGPDKNLWYASGNKIGKVTFCLSSISSSSSGGGVPLFCKPSQWASDATATNSYNGYPASNIKDSPGCTTCEGCTNSNLWFSATGQSATVEATFDTPTAADSVLIKEAYDPGFVKSITLKDKDGYNIGSPINVTDSSTCSNNDLIVKFPKTSSLVKKVIINTQPKSSTTNSAIDAVQLRCIPEPTSSTSSSSGSFSFSLGSSGGLICSELIEDTSIYGYTYIPNQPQSFLVSYLTGAESKGFVISDFNKDGQQDIAVVKPRDGNNTTYFRSGSISVLLNKGLGIFEPSNYYLDGRPTGLASGDFNSDGKLDIATSNDSGSISIFIQDRNGQFIYQGGDTTTGFSLNGITAADFNKDGKSDIAVIGTQGAISVLIGSGAGRFYDGSPISLNEGYPNLLHKISTADINKDGNSDLVTSLGIFLGDGRGSFYKPPDQGNYQLPIDAYETAALVDINTDGKDDTIASSASGLSLQLGNGAGTFREAINLQSGSYSKVKISDFNNDEKKDIIALGLNGVSILLNNVCTSLEKPPPNLISSSFVQGGTLAIDFAKYNSLCTVLKSASNQLLVSDDTLCRNGRFSTSVSVANLDTSVQQYSQVKLCYKDFPNVCSQLVTVTGDRSLPPFNSSGCTDSDGGKNYRFRGYTNIASSGAVQQQSIDTCYGPSSGYQQINVSSCQGGTNCKLLEGYCDNFGNLSGEFINCNNCVNGACLDYPPLIQTSSSSSSGSIISSSSSGTCQPVISPTALNYWDARTFCSTTNRRLPTASEFPLNAPSGVTYWSNTCANSVNGFVCAFLSSRGDAVGYTSPSSSGSIRSYAYCVCNSSGSSTGTSISSSGSVSICIDSDGGDNYGQQGSITVTNGTIDDTCFGNLPNTPNITITSECGQSNCYFAEYKCNKVLNGDIPSQTISPCSSCKNGTCLSLTSSTTTPSVSLPLPPTLYNINLNTTELTLSYFRNNTFCTVLKSNSNKELLSGDNLCYAPNQNTFNVSFPLSSLDQAIQGGTQVKLCYKDYPNVCSPLVTIFGNRNFYSSAESMITELNTPAANPNSITTGSDGNLWFTVSNKIAKITTTGITSFTLPTINIYPRDITKGPDSDLWFTDSIANVIGKITTDGITTNFNIPTTDSYPWSITLGPDGNLWFTEVNGNKIGKITPSGTITEYSIPTPSSGPQGITPGTDGNLWFTESTGNKIGRITPSGTITEFNIPTVNSSPTDITKGPDNNLWFTEGSGNKIGKITPSGTITEFNIPTANSYPWGITTGSDSNLWFTEFGANIGRISIDGMIAEFEIPTPHSQPQDITSGPNGNLWFTENQGNKIGKISIP